jgi:hypothetical protein
MRKLCMLCVLCFSIPALAGTYVDSPPAVTPVEGVSGGEPVPVTGTFATSGDQTVLQGATSTPWEVDGTVAVSSVGGDVTVLQGATSTPWEVDGTVAVSSVGGTVTVSGAVTTSGTATVSGTVAATQSGAWVVDASAQTSFAEEATSCGTGASVSIPATPLAGRRNILVQNQGPGAIRIGLAPTASVGIQLASGASMSLDGSAALKCIAEAATSTAFNIESK